MKIIGIGEVVWDCFPEGKRLGGAPINFCFFAKELGAESYPVTAIGEDELGDFPVQIVVLGQQYAQALERCLAMRTMIELR